MKQKYENLLEHAYNEVERALSEYNNEHKNDENWKKVLSGEYMVLNSLHNQVIIDDIDINKELKIKIEEILNQIENI